MLSYEWDEGEPLSARGDDSTGLVSERRNHTLLRPIYINAVENFYGFTRLANTISSSDNELAGIYLGFVQEKYIEVNRILANRAEDTGGCIVARSQMHNIIEERPTLVRTVEKRLLMPSFNHNDILFPLDGPLGRCGPSLRSTLECPLSDPDWPRCSVQQMLLRDQRLWLTKLCALVPDQVTWCTLLHAVVSFKPSIPLPAVKLPPRCLTHANRRVYPPETNPVDGRGYSYARGLSQRFGHDKFGRSLREFPVTGRPCARELQRRYGMEHPLEVYRPNVPRSGQSERSQDEFLPDYLRPPKDILDEEPHFLAEKPLPKPNYLGNPDSIYRLLPRKSGSDGRSETSTAGSCSPSHHHNGCSKKMCPCEGVKIKSRITYFFPLPEDIGSITVVTKKALCSSDAFSQQFVDTITCCETGSERHHVLDVN
ncbi:hypothetical protein KIN20_023578 [Parelaphostrongylus tenuis]|uniref:RNase NYN domain-containing protein n=1 Tax=Parelaphostrongylus tenuis TaxID=148309 RepID=A0AAD5NA80_PARTN|nr:hypothetical protein KIN20_023578 [Parelaphostrongylus tenuis]